MSKKNTAMVFVARRFSAPRDAVWKLWITPENVRKWWGPKDFTSPKVELDFRKGGKYLLCMRGAGFDGVVKDYYNAGEFTEVKPQEKIAWIMRFSDERGKTIEPRALGLPGDWPKETRTTAIFADAPGGGTMLTVQDEGVPIEALSPATQGWTEQLDKMEEALRGERPQKITTSLLFVGKQAGKAEEAMRLYTGLFEDSKILQLERYAPGDGDTVGWIKFGTFQLAGQMFHAMDSGLQHKFAFNPAVNLFVTCQTEEFDRLDAKLSKGGGYLMEKGRYLFAEKYCWINDRYGVSWQLFVPPKH